MAGDARTVPMVVIGDVNIDVVIAPVEKAGEDGVKWQQERQYREFRRQGGAWLVHEIVKAALGGDPAVRTYADRSEWCECVRPPCPVSVATIRKYLRDPAETPDEYVYRMDRRLIGWLRPARDEMEKKEHASYRTALEGMLKELVDGTRQPSQANDEAKAPLPELVIIHDHNNGFRGLVPDTWEKPFLEQNPHFAPAGTDAPAPRGVILWHTDSPVCKGHVWEVLSDRYAPHTVVVVNVEDLREQGIFLKEDLSLEQTAYDFLDQLAFSPLKDLARMGCLAVRFTNAVMIYSRSGITGDGESLYLAYLPAAHRGGSLQGTANGSMVGYTLLLVAALAQGIQRALLKGRGQLRAEWLKLLEKGIQKGSELGLAYGQLHFRKGFLAADFEDDEERPNPYKKLVETFVDDVNADKRFREGLRFGSLTLDTSEVRTNRSWSRVSALGRGHQLLDKALEIVQKGLIKVLEHTEEDPDAQKQDGTAKRGKKDEEKIVTVWDALRARLYFPYFKAGDLLLVERREVDSFEGLSTLIRNYLDAKDWKEPLCIAVFGPPGSGKSFAVKQLLKKAQHGKSVETVDFNVAQFRDFRDLARAFHVVQDHALGDAVPFVFFDEFDSAHEGALGWLKYFLAPMQDGKFRDGEITYQIGRAIFFFAGGTKKTFQEFYFDPDDAGLIGAKVPDFVSRLRGYLNISGINAQGEQVDDVTIIRRAILLRAFVEKNCKHVIDSVTKEARLNPDVIRAFLLTRRFEHGVRSMEAIVEMAAISLSRESFQKTSVPLEGQLKMHVDADDFLSHIQREAE